SARRVIRATSARRRAPLLELGRDFTAHVVAPGSGDRDPLGRAALRIRLPSRFRDVGQGEQTYEIGMPGRHQADNAALAVIAARCLGERGYPIPERAIAIGLERAVLPARIEVVSRKPLLIVDAAHNVASMEALIATLAGPLAAHAPRVLVFAASADKQIERMLGVAAGHFDHVIVTRYATNPRAATVEHLRTACRTAGLPAADAADSPAEAVARARRIAGRNGLVCVAGSFFLAAEIGAR
ncbi:MAG: glutamate ligase domain-containing protein, partial [Planctomycetia bacterium]